MPFDFLGPCRLETMLEWDLQDLAGNVELVPNVNEQLPLGNALRDILLALDGEHIDVACTYTLQDAEAVTRLRLESISVYLISNDFRGHHTTPRPIARLLSFWRAEYHLALPHSLMFDGRDGSAIAVRIELPVDRMDRYWLTAMVASSNEGWDEYYDEKYSMGRRERILTAVWAGWIEGLQEARAIRALAPALIHWGTRPDGPLTRVARRTFEAMKG